MCDQNKVNDALKTFKCYSLVDDALLSDPMECFLLNM